MRGAGNQGSETVATLAAGIAPMRGLVLVGPPGIGKTTLARAIVGELASTHRVRYVRGSRSGIDEPLGAYEAVLPPGVQQARAAITYIRDEIAREATPALLVVDDAHDLDDASAFVTLALGSSAGTSLLVCRRADVPLPNAIETLTRDGLTREYDVPPLDAEGVAAIGRVRLAGPLGPATAARLFLLSGGNPMLVNELIDAGLRAHVIVERAGHWHWVGEWPASVRLDNLVQERLDALDLRARDLLELIALAEPVTLPVLRRAIDAAGENATFLDDAARLERARLVAIDDVTDDVHVHHPLYAEVLRAGMPRARLHRHASVLAHLPDDDRPERRVRAVKWKLEAGVDVPADELLDAAMIAHAHEDLRATVDLARRAATRAPAAAGRVLGRTLDQLGDPDGAFEALEAAAAAAADPYDVVLTALARSEFALGHRSDPTIADGYLDEAEKRVPDAHDVIEPVRALHALLRGEPEHALDIAAPYLARGDDESLLRVGVGAALALSVNGRANEAVTIARHALAARGGIDVDAEGIARLALFATALVVALVETGECSEARVIAREGHARAERAGTAQAEGWFALGLASVELASGRLNEAAAWFAESAARFSYYKSPAGRWAWGGAALTAAFAGHTERASELLVRADAIGPTSWRYLDPLLARARAWTHAAAGDGSEAVAILVAAMADAHARASYALEAVIASDLARLGAHEHACAALDALTTRIDNPRTRHWASHARALMERDPARIVDAARELDRVGAVAESADALAQAAAMFWEYDDIPTATTTAAAAREHAARADDLETPAVRALRSVPPLSDRQAEIAALAATGLASRDIAKELVLSVRTVDNHLARVFRMFGVSARASLSDILAAWRPDALTVVPRPTVNA